MTIGLTCPSTIEEAGIEARITMALFLRLLDTFIYTEYNESMDELNAMELATIQATLLCLSSPQSSQLRLAIKLVKKF